jgi:hypothetical protein
MVNQNADTVYTKSIYNNKFLCQRATKSLLGMLFTKTVFKTDDNAIQASKYSIRYYFVLELQEQPVFVLVVFHGNEMLAIDFFFDISVM